ncbi:acyl carrier protein [Chloroflexi bacterium TSY]|nr:acyl carrier protein [Chloroflexi bacterium TSY]
MTRNEIFEIVKARMIDVIPDVDESTEIEEIDSMRDFGADSLDVSEVINETMRELRIKIELSELDKVNNISGFLDLAEEACLERA